MLTKKQAEAIESVLRTQEECGYDKSNIIDWKVTDLFAGDEEPLNQLTLETVIVAIYIGFEIEQTPESCGDDVMGDEVLKGDYILEHDGEMILETNALDYLVDFLGAVRKVAGE